MADPKRVVAEPLITIKTNSTGMIKVLELAKIYHAKLLQASTSEVYGEPEVHPQPESYYGNVNPVDPRAGYNESKRLAETLCYCYRNKMGLNTKIARIFNTYGPRWRGEWFLRSCFVAFHSTSARRQGSNGLWRWFSDQVLLLFN